MHVENILPGARERLVTITEDAPLVEAARRLRGPDAELVVVCDEQGRMRGVITKTDVVDRISHCSGASCTRPAASVMTREVVCCRPERSLREVWDVMKSRGLKHVPVSDAEGLAIGVLSARAVMQALVEETAREEELLRDYVMCVVYR